MNYRILICCLLMTCLSELALAQGAGGHVVRPSKTENTGSKPAKAQPAKVFVDGMTFKISDKSATLIKGKDAPTVSIPHNISYKGMNILVTKIGHDAFEKCEQLISIVIPNSVKTIAYNAFYGCRGLTSVTIPNSVTSIEESAFRYCSGLTSVTIPKSIKEIGKMCFYGCPLIEVKIPTHTRLHTSENGKQDVFPSNIKIVRY